MNAEEMKSAWNQANQPEKKITIIQSMTSGRNHPVLSGIRKQMIIEALAFAVFLFVYNDFFDGEKKPVYANLLLGAAGVIAILHNIFLYRIAGKPTAGETMIESISAKVSAVKLQGYISVVSRATWAACLLVFFTSGIAFTTSKALLLGACILCILVQFAVLARIWYNRTRALKETLFMLRAE